MFVKLSTSAALAALTVILAGCAGGQGEDEDLASAQSCLDRVPQSDPARAESCLPYVQSYSSPAANALKCSIHMTAGGLVESKIVGAYNALKDTSNTNKEAVFMASLSLDVPDVDRAYEKAVLGNTYCKVAQSKGLIYIGAAVVAGTYLNKTIKSITGSGVNINDPAGVATAVQTMLASCTSSSPAAACTADATTLGSTTVALADAYCASSSADQAVCGKVNSAVVSANGDPAKVGRALFCYLGQKTYNAATGACQ